MQDAFPFIEAPRSKLRGIGAVMIGLASDISGPGWGQFEDIVYILAYRFTYRPLQSRVYNLNKTLSRAVIISNNYFLRMTLYTREYQGRSMPLRFEHIELH